MTKEMIESKLNSIDFDALEDYSIIAVRITAENYDCYDLKVGDYVPESRVWIDGVATDELLDGACGIDARSNRLVSLLSQYDGNKLIVMAGRDGHEGNDIDEIILADSEIVAIA
jgi:hypothetical protein